MKFLTLPFFLTAILGAQLFPGQAPDAVVATVDGRKITTAQMQRYLRALPPQVQQNAMKDPKGLLQGYALMWKLAGMAEKNKLDQKSPLKEMLEDLRLQQMAQAQLNETFNEMPATPEDVQKHYEANKGRFQQAKVRLIYISFSPNAGPAGASGQKVRSEADAKALAEKVLAQARAGADFVKLVKEHSEDEQSKAKDGDFGMPISRNDKIPPEIVNAVFALKPGQISDPVRQANGFYLFRVDEFSTRPFEEVRSNLFTEVKQVRLKEWLDKMQKSLDIKIEETAAPAPAPAPPAAAPAPAPPAAAPK